ncbi:MAG TPA: 4Fe-4S dicluster domain-containing protein [Acidimicrobiia bacterium]
MPDEEHGWGRAEAVIAVAGLDALIRLLRDRGYQVVGPTVRDQAIVFDEVDGVDDLPAGWTDEQDGGSYRLRRRDDDALFGYAVGPHSWKQFLFPSRTLLWRAARDPDDGFTVETGADECPRYAFLGARSCDLHAIGIQDRVFLDPAATDPTYASGKAGAFVVAVNCGTAGGTCFCVSMETGPKATAGFDLALTELLDHDRHEFLVEVGTDAGAAVLAELTARDVQPPDTDAAEAVVEQTAASMGRSMDTHDIRDLLAATLEHPRWDDVAERCLSCTNCTLVCPTCFCASVEDVTDLAGEHAERWRRWDSCFTADHSYLHGGSVRSTTRSRYRQWLTHKLGTWIDQFGTSGCVGCGRCITWCPVGIDITEEVRAIRETPDASRGRSR